MGKVSMLPAAAALAPRLFGAEGQRPPNILYIMADDHASHAMSCYGSRINKTPNIDRIASEGMRFNNCFCTNSLCGPSRAVLLTGKYSHMNGFTRQHRQDQVRRLAAHVPQDALRGRLPDRGHRQVAPELDADGLRLLVHPARPGALL